LLSNAGAPGSLIGMAVAGLAGSAYAAHSLITSRIGQAALATTVAGETFLVAAVLVSPALLIFPAEWALATESWPKLLFLGVFATGLPYALYTWGLRRVAPSTAVTLALAEPLTAWVLTTMVIGEALTPVKVASAALLVCGLVAVTGSRSGEPIRAR
jgi:DME family drug/metabolite transporter